MFTDHDYAPKNSWKIKMKDSSRSLSKMTVSSKQQSTRSGIHMVQSFLMPALELKHYGDLLHWHDENSRIFAIRWQHKRGNQWTDKDAAVFVGWDQMKGRHGDASSSEYLVEAKQRFRNALRKIHNIRRVSTHDRNYRLYQIVDERDSEAIDIAKVLLSLQSGGVNRKAHDHSTQSNKDVSKKRKKCLEQQQQLVTPGTSDSDSGTEDMEEQIEVQETKTEMVVKAETSQEKEPCCNKPIDYTQPRKRNASTQVELEPLSSHTVPGVSNSSISNLPSPNEILNHLPRLKSKILTIHYPSAPVQLIKVQQVQQTIKQEVDF